MPYVVDTTRCLAALSIGLPFTFMTNSICNSVYTNASADMNWWKRIVINKILDTFTVYPRAFF
jgi:hypothetical protein